MSTQIVISQTGVAEKVSDSGSDKIENQEGKLRTESGEHRVIPYSDTEATTEGVARFLAQANQQEAPKEQLLEREFVPLIKEMPAIEQEIVNLQHEIAGPEKISEEAADAPLVVKPQPNLNDKPHLVEKNVAHPALKEAPKSAPAPQTQTQRRPEVVHSSLFSLARAHLTTQAETRQKKEANLPKNLVSINAKSEHKENRSVSASFSSERQEFQKTHNESTPHEREEREREGQHRGGQEKEKDDEEKGGFFQYDYKQVGASGRKKQQSLLSSKISASKETTSSASSPLEESAPPSVGSIFIRFMALMARILGQAEAEAHQLYQRVKERTDSVDTLTLLLSKINSEKKNIDWSKNDEMKALVEKVKELGVDIPKDKYSWSEDEKRLLKENISMRKDSMEKMTQLERTDMQRYLQEASQCHQARSNVLKLLKEVTDSIIANMRP